MRKGFIKKFLGAIIIILIFYFLSKNLFYNWQKIKEFEFSFNYIYLSLSFFFLVFSSILNGLIWKKIVDSLNPDNDLKNLDAIKINSFAQLGKYIPGKIFSVLGKIYLSQEKRIDKKALYLSAFFDAFFHPIAMFILSLILTFFFFRNIVNNFLIFYASGFLGIIFILILMHSKTLKRLFDFFLVKIKKEDLRSSFEFPLIEKIKIIIYYSIADILMGSGFFFLINSLTSLPLEYFLGAVGAYLLANILGLIVIFVPSGLGIREGILTLLLSSYFPLNIAVLISLIARVWAIAGDVFLPVIFYFHGKPKNLSRQISSK